MPGFDGRPWSSPGAARRMRAMEAMLVIILIVALGLIAQVAGTDSRGFDRKRSA
jgi:hypothetical protein